MDELVKFSIQEICYEGPSGCTLNRFWAILDERLQKEKFMLKPDFHMKKYLFTLIQAHQYILVNIKTPELVYESDEFQMTTKLIATKTLFDKLFTFDAEITWTDGVKGIYLAIIKGREKGMFQSALQLGGEKNAKNVFHFMKPLLKAKYVEKIPVGGTDENYNATNLCIATRFLKYSSVYQSHKALITKNHITAETEFGREKVLIRPSVSVFNEKVCALLLNAPNRILIVNDLQNILGFNTKGLRKGFMGRMQKLMPEFVQMVYVVDQNRPEMRSVRCFQLVKEYVKEDAEEMLDIQNKTMSLTISPVIQVYQTILATADRGITTSEILAVMPFLGIKVLNIMLAQLLGEGRDGKKTAGLKYVSVVGENAGTSRINRYYAIESPVSEIQRQDMKIIGFELPEFIDDFVEPLRNIPNQTPLRLQSALNSNVSSNITPAPTPQDSPRITDLELEDLLNCKHCKVALDVNFTDQDFTMEFCSKKCQDIYNTTESNANSKSPAKKNRKTATGLQRRQYLKDLLEINQFMDMTGRNIAKKIREYGLFRNDKTIGKHQIDSKTIERLVDSMKAANELKVVNVSFENFGGRSIMKKIICWPTANTDGPNFKAFVQSMKEESMLAKGATPARKVIEVADTIKRLAPPSLMPKAKLGDGYEGNVIAENYGYIFPKNQKMVALHKWLYDATVPDWATPIKERYIWKMMECTAKMPLAVYLQCFGVRFKCPPLDRLLSDPEFNSSTSIKDLPLDVKTAIINLNSFKDSFFTLISMLEVLELIVPLQKDSIGGYTSLPIATTRSQLPTFYRIVRRAPSLNFTTSPPTKDLVVFNTKADIELFWKNTEITYERMEKNPCVPADLLFLTRKRLWHYKRSYTNAQISSLNSWIDPKSKTTPISNDEVCKALAEELNLSLKAVKHFYSNYEFYERSAGERRRRKRKSRWRDDTSDDSDDSLEDYEDFNIYRGEHSGSEEDEFMERRSNPFSPDDDILLCIAAVVLEHFKGSKKPLHVLTQIFPLRNISKVAYRRRITYLRNKSGPKDIINTLSVFWPEFISDAKSQQNWLSGINDVLLSSNFLGVVYAFRKFVSLKDPTFLPFDELSLPELTGDFLFKDVSVACDAGLDVRNGRATKLAFFNNIILTVPQGNSLADFSDLSFDERSRRVQMAATAMKMILASPTEDYNAELAYKVLQSFSENELVLGLEILKENGTISKQQKIGPEVRFVPGLPNRGICLNDKFLSFFGRYLPDNFFKHAIAYREKILVQGDMTIPEGNSAGMFAAMYDMVIDGDVALTAVIPTVEYSIEEKDSCKYYLILAKNISLQLAANQVNPSPAPKRREIDSSYLSPSLKKRFSTKEKGKGPATASDRHIQQISSLSNHNFDFVSALYGKISDAESLGISYKDLADDVSVSLDALDVCLKQMIVAKLIEEVGFTHPRYIACVYLEEWKVSILSPNSGSVISFIPCVYSQFDGTLNYKLYRGCCQSLLGIIAQKPGVSFSGIYKRSKSVLNQMELRQLLEDLIGKGFISKTIAPIKVTEGPFDDLFEDPEVSHSSCYFPSKNFYQF